MKLLYVAPRYHTNQTGIMRGLTKQGHEVRFISHYAAILEDYAYVTPVVLGYSRLYRWFDLFYVKVLHRKDPAAIVYKIQHGFPPLRRLRKLICDFAPDLVILRERSVYSAAAYLVCRRKGYPCILYNQSPLWSGPEKKDLAHRIMNRLSPKVRMTPVIGVKSPGMSVKENDYFVPFVVEPCRAPQERAYFADDAVHILCIGKYEERKHHLMMLAAVEKLRENYPVRLTLTGEATTSFQKEYCGRVRQYVEEHHMEDIVTVKTNVPLNEMEAEYLEADVYVLPSTLEMASVSQLEAMSYSLPVICSDTNGTACYVEDGVTGYLFRDCDREDLEQKLTAMISDRERIRRMGAAGYRAVLEKYGFERYYETIMEMREKILRERLY
ncbi:MAG: glycosyltransferase family 4 protein [Bacteroidales bacterium]|nr:glycosyltransferase family 4 protein [Bacteroidales bacterium]MCM1414555.1 glycosyltransferase family 4 protein [bacterium]MCM1422605.1 glycosyltransferase family 4 protein [bacterium]